METTQFQFGAWRVNPADNTMTNGDIQRQMEPRAMDVLVTLCKQANTIISAEELLARCWGNAIYGDNPVHKVIAQIRRLLGDSSTAPEYIETIRKRGYRTIAPVHFDYSRQAQAGTWLNGSPFRGLQAFDEKYASVFFGRSDATFKLNQIIENQIHAENAVELVLVLGPSGSGKTSLIRAGVLPGLLHQSGTVQIISSSSFDLAEKGDYSLFTTLGGILLDLEVGQKSVFPNHSATSLGQLLETDIDVVLAMLGQSLAGLATAPTARHAIFIDRFEALFNLKQIGIDERNRFLQTLDKLARSRSSLILLACRNDFYPQLAAYPLLMEGKAHGAHFDVNPPSQAEIAQMIRLPALAANLSFDLDPQSHLKLDEVLCESANGNPDALPLLQYTLHELYRLRSPQGLLSFAAFHQLGGMEGAIGRRAEQVIEALSASQRQCLPPVLSLVTTISTHEAVVTSRRSAWSALRSENERIVVQALVESRLFVSELVDGTAGFGVAHEALLRRWPRVVEWINEHRQALQIRARVGELAQRWQQAGHSADLFIPEGRQLEEARGLLSLIEFSLAPQELALIRASISRAQWRKRLRLAVLGTLLVLALLAVGLGLSALSAKRQAQQRRIEVEGLMGFMLGDFADKLRPLARLDLLDDISTRAMDYFIQSDDDDLSPPALIQRAKVLQVLAQVQYTRANPMAASEALQSGNLILLKLLQHHPESREVLKNLAANAFWLGQIQLDKANWQQAGIFFNQYRDYCERLVQLNPTHMEWWQQQSHAHNNLGILALKQHDLAKAALEFRTALELENRALKPKLR